MNEKEMSIALEAIHMEALRLLNLVDTLELEHGLNMIVGLARYKHDIRTDGEIRKISEQ